jgi:hypothetical protein
MDGGKLRSVLSDVASCPARTSFLSPPLPPNTVVLPLLLGCPELPTGCSDLRVYRPPFLSRTLLPSPLGYERFPVLGFGLPHSPGSHSEYFFFLSS